MSRRARLPPLKSLHVFSSAAAHLSFAKAADELCVTAAAVSYQVRQLEVALGTLLFHRLPRSLELTREGMSLQSVCEKAFAEIADVVETVRSHSEQREVRVASVPQFSARVLFPMRQEFAEAHPHVEMTIEHTLAVPDFPEDECDFAVLFGKGSWPGLESDLLFNSPTGPACAPVMIERHRLATIADLVRLPILLDDSSFHSLWVDWYKAAGTSGWENLMFIPCNDIHALLAAAAQGYGMVMEPDFVLQDLLASGTVVRPFDTIMSFYGYHLVYPAETLHKESCRTFRDWFLERTAAHARSARLFRAVSRTRGCGRQPSLPP